MHTRLAVHDNYSLVDNILFLLVPSNSYLFIMQISKGLLEKYGPERVLDTPITEVTSIFLVK